MESGVTQMFGVRFEAAAGGLVGTGAGLGDKMAPSDGTVFRDLVNAVVPPRLSVLGTARKTREVVQDNEQQVSEARAEGTESLADDTSADDQAPVPDIAWPTSAGYEMPQAQDALAVSGSHPLLLADQAASDRRLDGHAHAMSVGSTMAHPAGAPAPGSPPYPRQIFHATNWNSAMSGDPEGGRPRTEFANTRGVEAEGWIVKFATRQVPTRRAFSQALKAELGHNWPVGASAVPLGSRTVSGFPMKPVAALDLVRAVAHDQPAGASATPILAQDPKIPHVSGLVLGGADLASGVSSADIEIRHPTVPGHQDAGSVLPDTGILPGATSATQGNAISVVSAVADGVVSPTIMRVIPKEMVQSGYMRDPDWGSGVAVALSPASPEGPRIAEPARFQIPRRTGEMFQEQLISVLRNPSRNTVHVQLEPIELGRVRISLTNAENGLQVHVLTERPETMDLLRRFSNDLLRDLSQMGYKDLSMSFSDNHRHEQQFKQQVEWAREHVTENALLISLEEMSLAAVHDGVDIRV